MKLNDLAPNPSNPRTITDPKLKMLSKSMKEFGSLDGILYNRRTQRLFGGHQRQKVDPTAEITVIKSYVTPTKQGTTIEGYVKINGENFPYREVDWDENKEKAANLAANKGAGEWDLQIRDQWMNDLQLAGFDLELTMFDEDERSKMVHEIQQLQPGCDEDEVPEHVEPKTKLGDIYQLGNHRLMCGDSTSIDAVEKLMNGEKVDMVFTDPPYNIAEKTKGIASGAPTNKQNRKLMDSEWDKGFDFDGVSASIFSTLADSCTVYVCTSSFVAPKIWEWMGNCLDFSGYCVWAKPNPFPSLMKRRWAFSSELICYGTRGTKYIFNYPEQGNALSVWTFAIGEGGLHPTQKPMKVPEHAILHSSNENQSILDLFGGSGSTLIACEKTQRRCFMMELDPHYCDIIVARWEKYSGKKAVLLD